MLLAVSNCVWNLIAIFFSVYVCMYFWHFGSQYIWLCCKLKVADWWIIDLMFLSHHHLSVSIRVCETVCLHVCVPAHSIKFSCWQCNSSRLIGVWTLSCLPTMTPTACLVWQSACLPKRACASPLISSHLRLALLPEADLISTHNTSASVHFSIWATVLCCCKKRKN